MENGGRLESPLRLDLGIVRAKPSEKIVKEILFAGMRANSYGEERSASLRGLISSELGVPCENISVGNGSLEILSSIARAFLRKGESSVTIPVPTFYGYKEFSEKRGAKVTLLNSSREGGKFKTDVSLLQELSKKSDLTFLCAPNNPTGEVFSEKEVGRLCSDSRGLVVLDQALLDPLSEEGISLSKKFGNLVLVRTFSKTRALAGLRVGFSVSEASLAEKIAGKLLPFGMNSVSQRAAMASIGDLEFQESLENLRKKRMDFFLSLLEENEIPVAGVCPNTVLLDFGAPKRGKEVVENLEKRNVFIFGGDSFDFTGLSNRFARVSLPTEKEAELFVKILLEEIEKLSFRRAPEKAGLQ